MHIHGLQNINRQHFIMPTGLASRLHLLWSCLPLCNTYQRQKHLLIFFHISENVQHSNTAAMWDTEIQYVQPVS